MTTTCTPVANHFQPIDQQPDALPMPNQTDKRLVRGEVGEDRDQFGRVAAPRVVDDDVGVLIIPPAPRRTGLAWSMSSSDRR